MERIVIEYGDFLKEKRLGRITFLPIENIKARYIDEDDLRKAKGVKGYIGVASELVKADRNLEDIVSNLLGRILVADDLDSARIIASRTGRSYKVMTLEGDSVNPGGSLTGGSLRKTGAGTGIIGRKAEIDSLTKAVAELEAKLADSEDQRQEVDDGIGTIKRELAQLGEQLLQRFIAYIIEVASGREHTTAEIHGNAEFAIFKTGVTL